MILLDFEDCYELLLLCQAQIHTISKLAKNKPALMRSPSYNRLRVICGKLSKAVSRKSDCNSTAVVGFQIELD